MVRRPRISSAASRASAERDVHPCGMALRHSNGTTNGTFCLQIRRAAWGSSAILRSPVYTGRGAESVHGDGDNWRRDRKVHGALVVGLHWPLSRRASRSLGPKYRRPTAPPCRVRLVAERRSLACPSLNLSRVNMYGIVLARLSVVEPNTMYKTCTLLCER